MALQFRLEDKDVTLHKLRKLLGMVTSSEKRSNTASGSGKNKPLRNKPKKPKKTVPPITEHHALTDIKKGDPCPACPNGRLTKQPPAILMRITGRAPLAAVKHITEQLKCNLCDYVVRAPLPEQVTQDGGPQQQYGYSARSVMAIHKHFSGLPYYLQETLNDGRVTFETSACRTQ